jgi:hypothetical protein
MTIRNVTRAELYELVWTKPATKIAKEFEVSDVWISKVCKRANIPKPPPGYWQALAAGKSVSRTALPPNPPLQPQNIVVLAEDWRYYNEAYPALHWDEPKTDDEPIPALPPPHVFSESMDDVRVRAERLTAPLKFAETLKHPHPATALLLKGDQLRAHDNAKSFYISAWDKPRYRHPSGLALLTALNQLFFAWTTLGATVSISGRKKQSYSVSILGRHFDLYFIDFGWDGTIGFGPANKSKDEFKYGFNWGRYEDDPYGNRTKPKLREYRVLTSDILRSLIKESIVLAEEEIRTSTESHYKWLARRREEYIESREQRRLAAIRRHEQEVQQLLKKRIEMVEDAIDRIDRADRLRSLIVAFDEKAKSGDEPLAGFEKWRRWANDQVTRIDPRCMSVKHTEQWIAKFHLHE